ncbi:ubiquinol-cytochrome c reductase core subunit 1 [Mycoemilia scoparia]|uniref:Cytochrome b-c1 complex subunit 2, mitochondrial n=1 Tax=Mycoemilia scoparia TaxID=417184 RepID=A0A9W7ZRU4_9FUNG|nr:ubiquinol-cytochrome c reductase core subunit 1 [Mycoemilia scoparia]
MRAVANILKNQQALSRLSNARSYASAAASNGIQVVSTAGSHSDPQTASVSVVIRAGSRYEGVENSGAAHFLKNWAFRNTSPRTSFRTIREAELQGATLFAEADRESITYTVECFKEDVPFFVDVLGDVVTSTKFAQHEFDEIAKQVQFEALSARSSPVTRVIDDLHHAVYRNGLGNSLYALSSTPVKTAQDVSNYAKKAFTASNVAVVGTGIDAQELAQIVGSSATISKLAAVTGPLVESTLSKFHAGQSKYSDNDSSVFYYALGFEGPKDAATSAVLAELLGSGSHIKWGQGVSPLSQIGQSVGAKVQAFSANYTDSNLVGVVIAAPNDKAADAVKKVAAEIQKIASSSVSEEAVKRAVASAQLQYALQSETRGGVRQSLACEAISPSQKIDTAKFSALTTQALSQAASATFAKPSVSAFGNSRVTPYLDTLGF